MHSGLRTPLDSQNNYVYFLSLSLCFPDNAFSELFEFASLAEICRARRRRSIALLCNYFTRLYSSRAVRLQTRLPSRTIAASPLYDRIRSIISLRNCAALQQPSKVNYLVQNEIVPVTKRYKGETAAVERETGIGRARSAI